MIKELVGFEKISYKVKITELDIKHSAFSENKFIEISIVKYHKKIVEHIFYLKTFLLLLRNLVIIILKISLSDKNLKVKEFEKHH